MTPINFCYWLQNFFELEDVSYDSPEGLEIVLKKLNLVETTSDDYNSYSIVFIDWLKSAIDFGESQEKVRQMLGIILSTINEKGDLFYDN